MPDAKTLMARLGKKTTIFTRTETSYEELTLDADEQRLLDSVDGARTLYDLVNTPPLQPSMNARILYAFSALQMIAAKKSRKVKVQVRTDGGTYSKE
jgi:hypothetical protein